MPEKDFEATSLGFSRPSFDDMDVESLIKETIAESKAAAPKQAKSSETLLSATPLSVKKSEPKKEPAKKAVPQDSLRAEADRPAETGRPTETGRQEEVKKSQGPGYEATFKIYKAGDIVKGKIVKIDTSGILVDINYNAEGLILPAEVSDKDNLKVGDEINVFIENLETKEGFVKLSKIKADQEVKWKIAFEAYKNKKVLEAFVTSAVKGGLVVDCHGIKGFIPASQVVKEPHKSLDEFVNQKIPIKIIQIDRRQGKVVLSHKLAASEKQRFDKEKLIDELEIGQVRRGKVASLKKFGAFVDLGGIEGLIHLTELSWKRVNHPSEILKIGDEIEVFVLGVDKEDKKIALGLKELQTDPWVEVLEKYRPGQIIKVKIARLTKFGAFADLDETLEGLIHISELSTKSVSHPDEAVKPGETVEVKILRILPEEQKIGLSIKEAMLDKEKKELKKIQSADGENKVTFADALKDKQTKAEAKAAELEEEKEEISGDEDSQPQPPTAAPPAEQTPPLQ